LLEYRENVKYFLSLLRQQERNDGGIERERKKKGSEKTTEGWKEEDEV
jgi:hypothetical protein